MTFTVPATSPQAASAAAFGRELLKACTARGIGRNELHRTTGVGRTAMDNYRTGSSLPRIPTARLLAVALDWPRLAEIATAARTKPCLRCRRPFTNDGGNQGAKRYCSPACRDIARSAARASTHVRQHGQTGDGRRRFQALTLLRSGIRIAEGRANELTEAIAAMCASCEPEGLCRTADCPLRGFSPLPLEPRDVTPARTNARIRADSWTPARRARQSAMTCRLHAEGRIPIYRERHPAHDPLRREAWIARIRASKAAKRRRAPIG